MPLHLSGHLAPAHDCRPNQRRGEKAVWVIERGREGEKKVGKEGRMGASKMRRWEWAQPWGEVKGGAPENRKTPTSQPSVCVFACVCVCARARACVCHPCIMHHRRLLCTWACSQRERWKEARVQCLDGNGTDSAFSHLRVELWGELGARCSLPLNQ